VSDAAVTVTPVETIHTDVFEERRDARSQYDRASDAVPMCTICGRELPPFARRGYLPRPPRRYRRGARPRIFWAPSIG
jgi:hypothetical protein